MADDIVSLKVICSGGLNSNENSLDLSENNPGAASRLINYEPSLYGGYRRIDGYSYFDSDYPAVGGTSAEGKVLGVAIYKDPTGAYRVIAARKDVGANTYSFYRWLSGTGWVAYTTGLTLSYTVSGISVSKIRHKQFNFGDGNKIVFVDGVNNATLFDGTDWYAIDSADTGADIDHAGGAQVLDAPSIVDVFQNHVFLSGDPSYNSIIAHSAPNSAYDWTSASGAGQITTGMEVVQIKPFRDDLFVLGNPDSGIKKVVVNNDTFVLQNVASNVGCIARDSVLEIGGDIVFLASDGIRPIAGTSRIGDVELETISKAIQQKLSILSANYPVSELNGLVIRGKSQLRYFISDENTQADVAYGILGGLTLTKEQIKWEFSEIRGIRVSCCTSGYIDNQEYVLHGDYDGNLYRQENGNSFNTSPILSVYSTPYLDGGDTEVRKNFHRLNTFMRAEGEFTFNIAISYDWGDADIPKPGSYFEEVLGAPIAYGSPGITYDDYTLVYGGNNRPVIKTSIQGSGFSIKTTFVTYEIAPSHTIQGLVYEFQPQGRL